MHNIYKLKELLMEELKDYGQKGELTPGSLEVIDKLAHATKNICKIIEDCEAEEEGYSSRGMGGTYRAGSNEGGNMSGGMSYARGGRGGRRGGANQYGSYARGGNRGGGYSRADGSMEDLLMEMDEIMPMLSEDKRREAQRFVEKMRGM